MFMRMAKTLALLAVLTFVAACGSGPDAPPQPAGGGKAVDPATAGALTGRVAFEGTPPAPDTLRMAADPACAELAGPNPQDDAVLIQDGGLQNVFVYVKQGLDPAYSFDVPATPVNLEQRGCRYIPRVFGVRAGQPLEISNDDDTFHNVHPLPRVNREFNRGMSLKGERHTHTFTEPEVMVRFKCDVHSWMSAHVGAMAHPFFALTGPDGRFEISGLPPGTYTIEAWHERFGTQTREFTVGDGQTQSAEFSFSAES
jgi:plastocyanin